MLNIRCISIHFFKLVKRVKKGSRKSFGNWMYKLQSPFACRSEQQILCTSKRVLRHVKNLRENSYFVLNILHSIISLSVLVWNSSFVPTSFFPWFVNKIGGWYISSKQVKRISTMSHIVVIRSTSKAVKNFSSDFLELPRKT